MWFPFLTGFGCLANNLKEQRLIKRLLERRFSSPANYFWLIKTENGDVMTIGNPWSTVEKHEMEKWFQYQLSGLSTRSPDDCCSWTGLDPRKVLKLFLPVEVVKEYPLLFQIDLNESSSKSKWNTRKSWTEELWFCWNIQSQYRTFCLFVISHSFRLSLEPCFHWCLERRLDGPQDVIYFQKHMMTKSFLFSEVGRCLLPWQGWSQGAKVDTVSMDAKVKGSFHSFFALGGWETLAPKI